MHDIRFHSLSTSKSRLATLLLLATGLVSCLLLLLVGQSREHTSNLADLDILERLSNVPSKLFDKGSVERLRLVSLNDVFDNLPR